MTRACLSDNRRGWDSNPVSPCSFSNLQILECRDRQNASVAVGPCSFLPVEGAEGLSQLLSARRRHRIRAFGGRSVRCAQGGLGQPRSKTQRKSCVDPILARDRHRDEVCTSTQEQSLFVPGALLLETNHGSVGECVDALRREVAGLRDYLRQGKPSVLVISETCIGWRQCRSDVDSAPSRWLIPRTFSCRASDARP